MKKVKKSPEIGWIISDLRGEMAEEKVKRVLEELERENKIWAQGQTLKWGENDRKGVDFYFYPEEGSTPIPLQVKSHLSEEERKKLKLEEIQPGIWCKGGIWTIEAPPQKDEEEIREKILKILEIEEKKKRKKKKPLSLKRQGIFSQKLVFFFGL